MARDDDETKNKTKGKVYYTERLAAYDPRVVASYYLGMGPRWRSLVDVDLTDGRQRECDVDRHGFELSKIEIGEKEKWLDPRAVASELFPAAERILEARFPGAKALAFDHILRMPTKSPLSKGPVHYVHNDYSVDSGRPRIAALLKDSADPGVLEEVLRDRVAIVNVWCPLSPVKRDPLAFVDWRTTDPKDLVVVKLKYTDRDGETSLAYRNDRHEWVFFPRMQPGEAVLLKTWDSPGDGRSRFAIHAAPQLVDSSSWFFSKGDDAPARESIELRCMVLFHPKAKTDLLTAPFVAPHILRLEADEGKGFEKLVSTTLVDGDPNAW